jgi:uncharacterized membrane protein (DUF485 family)
MNDLSSEEHYKIYKNIEKRVLKRFERRKEFFSHLVAYVISMIGMWAMVGLAEFGEGFWGISAAVITVGWTMGVLIHIIQFVLDELGERAIDTELEKAGLGVYQRGVRGKDKHGAEVHDAALMRLGEDGELVEVESDFDDSPFYDEARS